jgi:6-phosphofructokinase 1
MVSAQAPVERCTIAIVNRTGPIGRIAIATGGGDAPGLNAVIKAVTLGARRRGWSVTGLRDAFNGILHPEQYPNGGVIELDEDIVRYIGHQGGTIIGTTNRGNPTNYPIQRDDGSWTTIDRTDELLQRFSELDIDALISVGGDGSLEIAHHLHQRALETGHRLRVIGVPKTIDNDLDQTTSTFGFDTAVSFATEAIDRLFSTAASHGRVMVVEVMGRYAGWIALHCGVATGAHAILIPEIPYRLERVAEMIDQRRSAGRDYAIVVVAEGAAPIGGEITVASRSLGHAERLGGVGDKVASELERLTSMESRSVVLGHLLRGGTPTSTDRLLGLRFGGAAIRAIEQGYDGVMVALAPPTVRYVSLLDATRALKKVPVYGDTMLTARDLGVCFGD